MKNLSGSSAATTTTSSSSSSSYYYYYYYFVRALCSLPVPLKIVSNRRE
ncbi:hypothetical protein HMPREF1981_02904 [Bacteroides pyogenes F0041]|uniref:Uncharacterized protein n=1 Tax=Bacteroides pyogenes F0041 TaxID=1321819 RepID=U2CCI9_9BACE|nr:hypothetical protein HMPREF1981_02904 [Bacteroides pyogenes F0041]